MIGRTASRSDLSSAGCATHHPAEDRAQNNKEAETYFKKITKKDGTLLKDEALFNLGIKTEKLLN